MCTVLQLELELEFELELELYSTVVQHVKLKSTENMVVGTAHLWVCNLRERDVVAADHVSLVELESEW